MDSVMTEQPQQSIVAEGDVVAAHQAGALWGLFCEYRDYDPIAEFFASPARNARIENAPRAAQRHFSLSTFRVGPGLREQLTHRLGSILRLDQLNNSRFSFKHLARDQTPRWRYGLL